MWNSVVSVPIIAFLSILHFVVMGDLCFARTSPLPWFRHCSTLILHGFYTDISQTVHFPVLSGEHCFVASGQLFLIGISVTCSGYSMQRLNRSLYCFQEISQPFIYQFQLHISYNNKTLNFLLNTDRFVHMSVLLTTCLYYAGVTYDIFFEMCPC